jgi:hypothetical protein
MKINFDKYIKTLHHLTYDGCLVFERKRHQYYKRKNGEKYFLSEMRDVDIEREILHNLRRANFGSLLIGNRAIEIYLHEINYRIKNKITI